MKHSYSIFAAALLLGTALPRTQAAVEVSVDFFHDNLDAYGDWREVGDYGYCWHPRDVDASWRPYGDGHWLYTDAGWTWDSEEPYSWAVYHYGRWTRVDEVGWVWVPGTEWGPAWVSWRRSPQYVGWAPLPPEARFDRSAGLAGRVDVEFDIGPLNYNFVEMRNFGAPRLRTVFVDPRENITIINQTTNITRITYTNNVVFNGGPQYEEITRVSAQPIRRLKLDRREDLGGDGRTVRAEQLRSRVEGDSFHVLAPAISNQPATAPKKVAAKVEKVQVDHGWKNAGPPAEVAKAREKIKTEPATPVAAETTRPAPAAERPVAAETNKAAPGVEKPIAAETDKPGKMKPGTKPAKPEVTPEQPVPPIAEKPIAPNKPKKGAKKGDEVVPEAPVPQPKERGPEHIPKPEAGEAPRNPVPPEGESPREKLGPGKGEPRPHAEPPAERKPERPIAPEPHSQARPEPHPQAAPAGAPAEAPKGKGKEKDEKKDEKKDGKPE